MPRGTKIKVQPFEPKADESHKIEEVRPGRKIWIVHENRTAQDASVTNAVLGLRRQLNIAAGPDLETRRKSVNVIAFGVPNREIQSPAVLPGKEILGSLTNTPNKKKKNAADNNNSIPANSTVSHPKKTVKLEETGRKTGTKSDDEVIELLSDPQDKDLTPGSPHMSNGHTDSLSGNATESGPPPTSAGMQSVVSSSHVTYDTSPEVHIPGYEAPKETPFGIRGFDVLAIRGKIKKHGREVFLCNQLYSSKPGPGVLFFFHGVGGSSEIWVPQIRYFSELGYEVVSTDLLGHGRSATPVDEDCYLFDELVLDALEVFDSRCGARNVLIGHSYGTSLATYLASVRSPLVTKLILVNGGSPAPLAPQPGVFDLPVCCLAGLKPSLWCCFKRGAFYKASECKEVEPKRAFDVPARVLRHVMQGQWWMEGDETFHRTLCIATLLIHGAKDTLVSMEEEEEMHKCVYGSRLEVIPNTGHMSMMEAPDKVNQLIHDFILEDFHKSGSLIPREEVERMISARRVQSGRKSARKRSVAGGSTRAHSVVSLRSAR